MIGLDTNILLRYLIRDNVAQWRRAAELLERELTQENPGFISAVVMAELAWVLRSVYAFEDGAIAAAIERILQVEVLIVQHESEVFAAITAVRQGRAGFADALIGAINAGAGCSRTVTFDRKAARLPSFEIL